MPLVNKRMLSARQSRATVLALLLSVSLTIAAIILQTGWTVLVDRDLSIDQAKKEQIAAIRSLEEHAFQTIQDADRAIGAAIDAIDSAGDAVLRDKAALRSILVREHQGTPHIQSLRFITVEGVSSVNTFEKRPVDIDISDREHVRFILAHPDRPDSYVGNPIKSRYDGAWVLPVIRNIRSRSGARIGMLCAYLSLDYFNDFYRRIAAERQAVVTLYSDEGVVMMHWPFDEHSIGLNIGRSAAARTILTGPREGFFETADFIGTKEPVLLAYRRISGIPLTVVYAIGREDTLLPWSLRTRSRLLFSAAVIALIGILAYFLFLQIRRSRRSEASLESSEKRYLILYESAADAITLIDRQQRYVDCNPAALRLFDVQHKDQVIGRHVGDFSPAAQPAGDRRLELSGAPMKIAIAPSQIDARPDPSVLIAAAFAGSAQLFEWATLRRGRLFFNEITLSRGNVDGEDLLFAVFRDINQRKLGEALHESQNQILHMISAGVELPMILHAVTQFLARHAPTTRSMILLVSEDQSCFTSAVGPDLPPPFLARLASLKIVDNQLGMCEAVLTKCPVMVDNVVDLSLATAPASVGSWPIMAQRGQILGVLSVFQRAGTKAEADEMQLIGIATDLAGIAIESRRSEQRIRYLAHYDELTGLPNRSLYTQHLDKALLLAQRNGKQVGVLFLDLDRFKNINDTFGHETGDSVLRDVAVRFVACLRDCDVIGRVGGDEFIALIESYDDPLELGEVAQRLLEAAAKPFEIAGQECRLGTSIGIATFPLDGQSAQTLLKNADIAMYRAKSTGKNNYQFYSAEMNTHSIERLALESRLRRGIERREFVMHYQPKVDAVTGNIVGAEALVRWNHPERGLLYPLDFIGMAEETGLINALGMLVLDTTCADITRFAAAGISFGRIAINLSGSQFDEANLLHDLIAVVDAWQVDPCCLEFEITESMVMHNREQAIQLMDGMMKLGFSLSIDDFGTGYSSLAYLKRFPVDSVKVDKSFINDIPGDPNDSAIVKAIIVMAHTLGLKVTAEGVETLTQLETLQGFGCDEYQGYFFSKPVPAEAFIEIARRHSVAALTA